jgi:hypothetical protein
MKRIIVSVFAVVVLAGLLAAPASAAVKHFTGSVNGGGRVAFDVQFNNGKPRFAGLFELRQIPVSCDEGETLAGYTTDNVVNVTNKRKFTYRFNFGQAGTARISGRISKSGKRASGITTANVDLSPTDNNCTTGGPRRWNASR